MSTPKAETDGKARTDGSEPVAPGWVEVTAGSPCPICLADAGCQAHESGEGVACLHRPGEGAEVVERGGLTYHVYRGDTLRKAEIAEGIRVVHDAGETFELRVLNIRPERGREYNASGYFTDPATAAEYALAYDGRNAEGIYFNFNQCDPNCLARAPNKIKNYPKVTTSDVNILRRRWLFIDFDSNRPAGVCATDAQVAAAARLAEACKDFLREEFAWPAPLEMSSGNGRYLFYRVDLPNDRESTVLVDNVVKALIRHVEQMDLIGAHIDVKDNNAGRIARLPGSHNRKGFATPEQPHRRARILARPPEFVIVSKEQLQALADSLTTPVNDWLAKPSSNGTHHANGDHRAVEGDRPRLKVGEWLTDHYIAFRAKDQSTSDGRTVYRLSECPFNPDHGRNGEVCIMQGPKGELSAKCMHNGCAGRGWQDFKEKIGRLERWHHDPPYPFRTDARHLRADFTDADGDNPAPRHRGYNFDVIDSKTFAEATYKLEWLIRRLMVRYQAILLGGPRKSLKTSIEVDLALSLGTGTPFLGMADFHVYRRNRVALLSGESGEAVIQETAKRISAAKGINLADADVLWGFQLPQLACSEHLAALAEGLDRHKVEVCIIDPLYLCLLAGIDARGIDAANLFDMGPLLLSVVRTCLDVQCTPILTHHTRKNLASPFEPLELEDLAFSGIQEFARQWVLLNRREKYQPGSGIHRLWMVAGGSAGQGGQWGIDIEEGQLADDFTGRVWKVSMEGATEVRQTAKQEKQAQRTKDEGTKLLQAIDRLAKQAGDPYAAVGAREARAMANLSNDAMIRAVAGLVQDGVIEDLTIPRTSGRGPKEVQGLRRKQPATAVA
jgi:replicative DNA helicase